MCEAALLCGGGIQGEKGKAFELEIAPDLADNLLGLFCHLQFPVALLFNY